MIKVYLLVIALFVFLAIEDIKYMEVPINILAIGIIIGIGINIYFLKINEWTYVDCALSIIPGLMFMICHFVFPTSIGIGDGWAIVMSELCLSLQQSILSLLITVFASWIVSVYYLIKNKPDKRIPYITYIALGHIAVSLGGLYV